MILAGAGVGGGSLNYANTLYVPPEPFFNDPQWSHITDWRAELMPHYEQAQRMLGVVDEPDLHRRRPHRQGGRRRHGRAATPSCPTPVGVFFGPDGTKAPGKTVPDPYFGGAGPDAHRLPGMRLLHDRLPLRRQEHAGEELPRPRGIGWGTSHSDDDGEGLRAALRRAVGGRAPVRTGSWLRRDRRTFTATHVILAAGTWGTQHLLFKMRDKGKLPRLSERLGVLTRTNSESIVGAATAAGLAGSGLDPRRRDHLVDPPDAGHPHRARAATARAPTRWGCCRR